MRRIRIELLDHRREFVERAAKPLPVLLREFRDLRGKAAEQQADGEREAA
jgi:hypothetical protein